MSTAWEEISRPPRFSRAARGNAHSAYFFRDSAEKQMRLFRFCEEKLSGSAFVLYVAGKQGTKGIRLSMKDSGIDVAGFERQKKFRIVDSEEWYLVSGRTPSFKSREVLSEQIQKLSREAIDSGNESLVVVSETDQIVRKGFLLPYVEFEKSVMALVENSNVEFICAYDERELTAARMPKESIEKLHEVTIG